MAASLSDSEGNDFWIMNITDTKAIIKADMEDIFEYQYNIYLFRKNPENVSCGIFIYPEAIYNIEDETYEVYGTYHNHDKSIGFYAIMTESTHNPGCYDDVPSNFKKITRRYPEYI